MLDFDASSELLRFGVGLLEHPALAAHGWKSATQTQHRTKPPQFGVTTTLQHLTPDCNPKTQPSI